MNFWMIDIGEFDSGRDRECDKDLDTLIWELGDYENEEPRQEADEYMEEHADRRRTRGENNDRRPQRPGVF